MSSYLDFAVVKQEVEDSPASEMCADLAAKCEAAALDLNIVKVEEVSDNPEGTADFHGGYPPTPEQNLTTKVEVWADDVKQFIRVEDTGGVPESTTVQVDDASEKAEETGEPRGYADSSHQNFIEVVLSEEDVVEDDAKEPAVLCEECLEREEGRPSETKTDGARLADGGGPSPRTRGRRGKPRAPAASARTRPCAGCGKALAARHTPRKRSHVSGGDGPAARLDPDERARARAAERPHSCPVCARSFARRRNLEAHSASHVGRWQHVCGCCGKGFWQASDLRAHASMHARQRPHACRECDGRCARAASHAGERRYPCGECCKSFTRRSDLRAHARAHSGDWLCVCGLCGKGFARHSDLERHAPTHTGEKPHVCEVCGKAFSRLSNMKAHSAMHAPR